MFGRKSGKHELKKIRDKKRIRKRGQEKTRMRRGRGKDGEGEKKMKKDQKKTEEEIFEAEDREGVNEEKSITQGLQKDE